MAALTSSADATPVGAGPVWTVAATAARLGVATSTLRSWSRRYGIGPAVHHSGQHRRYTADDIAELDAMRRLVDQGVALAAAAGMARASIRHRPPVARTGRIPAVAVRDLVGAGRALVEQCVDARLLGPSVDDRVLSDASATLRPAAVVVWAQVRATAAPDLVNARTAGSAHVVAVGPGWAGAALDPRATRVNSLRGALAAITAPSRAGAPRATSSG